MHFFEFKVDSDDMCQSIVLYTTHIVNQKPEINMKEELHRSSVT